MTCSVVIPTCNRTALLERCLTALAGTAEIVVADDGASAETEALAEAFGARYVRSDPAHRGPAAARNAGWRAATGAIIAFTDDDTIPDPCWVTNGVAAIEASGAGAAWGDVRMPIGEQPSDYERDAARLEHAVFVTANCFVRRSVLVALGGFDETFTMAWREDSDLYFRLLDAGYRVVHAPDAVVMHPIRPAPWWISLHQQTKTAFDALLYKKHPERYRAFIRPPLPRVFYATVIAGIAGLAGSAVGGIVWAALTAGFCAQRLAGTSHSPRHLAEVAVTSILIPPLSVFWRLRGAARFRVLYW
ncbi:MAG TPA: glycosyltransferase [Gemmatimonadaceae bacterium]|nr:glycosyltransferase [Gemmatimonadaceae bacterium]